MCPVLQYNVIAKEVAAEVGGIVINDLWAYVEDFCSHFPQAPAPFAGNYTSCAIQTTGLHFFNTKPSPSGQQYTGISVAQAAQRLIPKTEINNKTTIDAELEANIALQSEHPLSCGDSPAALDTTRPNILIIGDSIWMPGLVTAQQLRRSSCSPAYSTTIHARTAGKRAAQRWKGLRTSRPVDKWCRVSRRG